MTEDDVQTEAPDGPQEPVLDQAGPPTEIVDEKPIVSEEDEMLMALKNAIKPENK
jgi:hypothetical protein